MCDTSTGAIEGSDDPGRLFQKKHHVMMILGALGLLQMKGCDEVEPHEASSASYGIMVFTLVLGFIFMVFWFCLRRNEQVNANMDPENGPNANPAVSNEPVAYGFGRRSIQHAKSSSIQSTHPTAHSGRVCQLAFGALLQEA